MKKNVNVNEVEAYVEQRAATLAYEKRPTEEAYTFDYGAGALTDTSWDREDAAALASDLAVLALEAILPSMYTYVGSGIIYTRAMQCDALSAAVADDYDMEECLRAAWDTESAADCYIEDYLDMIDDGADATIGDFLEKIPAARESFMRSIARHRVDTGLDCYDETIESIID